MLSYIALFQIYKRKTAEKSEIARNFMIRTN